MYSAFIPARIGIASDSLAPPKPWHALHVEALALTAAAKQKLADGQAEAAAQLLTPAEQKLTAAQSPQVAQNALGWAQSIWHDILG